MSTISPSHSSKDIESWSTISGASAYSQEQARNNIQTAQNKKRRGSSAVRPPTHQNIKALEVMGDEIPSTDSGLSWTRRISWLRGSSYSKRSAGTTTTRSTNANRGDRVDATVDSIDYWLEYRGGSVPYVGGSMDTDHPFPNPGSPLEAVHGSFAVTPTNGAMTTPRSASIRQHPTRLQRIASWFTQTSHPTHAQDDEDSIGDFDESEWTPQDTSYGAAIPVGGWIPKTIRRLIEWTLLGIVICSVAFLVISTSIKIGDSHSSSSAVSGSNRDDDTYMSYHNGYNNNNNNNNDDAAAYSNTTDDGAYEEVAGDDGAAGDDDKVPYDSTNDGSFYNYAYGNRNNYYYNGNN